MGVVAAQPHDMFYVVTGVLKKQPHVLVPDRLVGRDHRDILVGIAGHAQRCQRRDHRVGAGGQAGALPHRFLDAIHKAVIALDTAPEGFRRHTHHHVIRFAGHQAGDGGPDGLAQHIEELHEVLVIAEVGVFDHEATEVPGDPARDNALAVVLHRGVGGGNDHPQLRPVADVIIQVAIGMLVPVAGFGQIQCIAKRVHGILRG